MIFLPKLFYTAIVISVVFGLTISAVFGARGRGIFSGKLDHKIEIQQDRYQQQSDSDINSGGKISQINHIVFNWSSILIAKSKNRITNPNDTVNTNGSRIVIGNNNKPEPTLINKADSTLSWEDWVENEKKH